MLKLSQKFLQRGFLRFMHQTGSALLSKDLQKITQVDDVEQSIKSATDTLDLFDALSQHDKILSADLVMQSLKTIFTLQKSGNTSLQTAQITNHPQFQKLCRDLRTASRSLEINDIIQALKVLSYLGISANSNIVYILLNMLRQQINDLTLSHIMFLEFLLKKQQKTPLVEALEIALPMIFQIQLSEQLDHENVPELVELLIYVANNNISEKCIMNVISALTLHGDSLKIDEAVSVIWALSELKYYKSSYDRLLHNCFEVFKRQVMQLSFDRADMVLHKCVNKCTLNCDAFYDEVLFNAVVNHSIQNDVGLTNAAHILKKFNRINFVNISLLDYISQKLLENPENIKTVRPMIFFNIITAFSIANYLPKMWNTFKYIFLQNPVIQSSKYELPWMKLNLELLSINCYDKNLIEKVFDDAFLDQHLSRDQNFLDYLQMLLLYQCTQTIHKEYDGQLPGKRFLDKAIELNLEKDQFPLQICLEKIYGGENYVQTKMSSKLGHLIDHVIIFDKDQQPIDINLMVASQTVEELNTHGHQIVAILGCPKSHYSLNQPRLKGVFRLRIQTIQALGIEVVPINLYQWSHLPEHERLPYLEREINYANKPR